MQPAHKSGECHGSQSHQLWGLELGVGWRRTGRKFRERIGMIKERQGVSTLKEMVEV